MLTPEGGSFQQYPLFDSKYGNLEECASACFWPEKSQAGAFAYRFLQISRSKLPAKTTRTGGGTGREV
jgi:hypothetical protein